MMTRNVLSMILIATAAGCTDSVDSIAREYRNASNEGVDALIQVTSDAQAGRMRRRVFQPLNERFKDIDRRLEIVRTNRSRKEIVEEVYQSDGLQLYLADLETNRQRYALEISRLRNLHKQYIDRERELLRARGDDATQINEREVCPNLFDLLNLELKIDDPPSPVATNWFAEQLVKPKIYDLMRQFSGWNLENYDKSFNTLMNKRKAFAPPEFQLVY